MLLIIIFIYSPAGAVHRSGVCVGVESKLQLGLVADVSLAAQVHQRNAYGKSPSRKGQDGIRSITNLDVKRCWFSCHSSVKCSPW